MGLLELLQGIFSKIFKQNLFEHVLAIIIKLRMTAEVHVEELIVKMEKSFAKFLAQPTDLQLGATIIIMTEMTSKENETNLMT